MHILFKNKTVYFVKEIFPFFEESFLICSISVLRNCTHRKCFRMTSFFVLIGYRFNAGLHQMNYSYPCITIASDFFFLLEQGLHQVTILLTFMHSRAAFPVQLQHSTHFYNYHMSNSHECMGVNGEALQLHAVYKRGKKNFEIESSYDKIIITIVPSYTRKNITGSFLPAKILIRETIFTSYW